MKVPVSWRITLIGVGSALLCGPPSVLRAQENTGSIQGSVVDAGSRRPILGAQVLIVGTQVGALTDASGTFRLLNIGAGQRNLRARFIGFAPAARTVEVVAGQATTVNFELSQSAIQLDEVVTTGTGGGVVAKREQGNSVAIIKPPEFAPISTFSDALQGREAGVVGLPSSGLTGEGARIRIRGNASLSQSNEPVIYIDGVRVDNGGGFGQGFVGTGGGGQPSRLDDIDPQSIERIEILKGAAAATLYGTEASNGVIQIFTKKGIAGTPRWTFDADQAVLNYPKGRIEANYGFARTASEAARLSHFYGEQIAPYQVFSRNFATPIFETGNATILSASVSGGTPLLTYYVSGRFNDEDGPFGATELGNSRDLARKYQGTINLGLNPGQRIKLNIRTLYADTHNEVPDNNNSIYSPYTLALFSRPQRAECDASRTGPGDTLLVPGGNGVAGPGRCTGPGNPTGASTFATLREALQREIGQDARHFNGTIKGTYVPASSLIFDATFGVDYTGQRSTAFLPFGNNIDFRTNQANEGDKSVDSRVHQEITLGLTGNWTQNLTSSISSALLVGGQGFLTKDDNESSNNQGFPGPGIEVVNGGSNPVVFEVFSRIVNAGIFAEERLGWRDWIFGTVGGRYDYNSAFGENAGGVFYPKASVSVILSDRPGWNTDLLSTLRLRSAIGKAGKQPGAFDKLTTYGPLTSELGGGLVPQNLGNPDLKPEIATEWEVGAEIGILDNRAALEFTRWNRTLKDALVARQFPVTGGFFALQLDNVGEMKAFGWEAALKAFPVNTQSFSVDLFANTAFLHQEVTSLGGAPPLKVGGSYPRYRNFIVEGLPPGALLGGKVLGPCPAGATTTRQGGACLASGQLPFDLNRDGRPDTEAEMLAVLAVPIPLATNPNNSINFVDPLQADDDNDGDPLDHYLGKSYPDFQGAFGGTVTVLRNWRLSSLFEYKAGDYTITDLTGGFRRSNNSNGGNTRLRAETEATLLNPASTAQQRLEAAKTWAYKLRALTPYDGLNQNFPGDFVRWRELNLTYTTPARFANQLGVSDVAITFGVRNLALWTRYPGVDPEVNVYGRSGAGAAGGGTDNNFGEAIDAFGFPLARRFSFSVRAGF